MDLWAVFGWTGGGLCALYVLLPFLVRFYPWIAHRIVFLHFGKPYPFSLSLSVNFQIYLSVCQWEIFFSFLCYLAMNDILLDIFQWSTQKLSSRTWRSQRVLVWRIQGISTLMLMMRVQLEFGKLLIHLVWDWTPFKKKLKKTFLIINVN